MVFCSCCVLRGGAEIYASRNCRKFVYFSWAIRVNHAAGYLCRVAILNPFQESYLLGERIISFDRAETNHDKVASPKQKSNEVPITLHIFAYTLKLCSLRITSENLRSLTQLLKKYSSYIFLLNQGRSIF